MENTTISFIVGYVFGMITIISFSFIPQIVDLIFRLFKIKNEDKTPTKKEQKIKMIRTLDKYNIATSSIMTFLLIININRLGWDSPLIGAVIIIWLFTYNMYLLGQEIELLKAQKRVVKK